MNDDLLKEDFLTLVMKGDKAAIDDFIAVHPGERRELEGILDVHALLRRRRELPAMGESPPGSHDIVPGYRILDEIGRGGMSVVYRAIDESTGREVALKVFTGLASSSARERFLREATIIGGLRSSHIVKLHRCGESSGRLFHAMELLDGETLAELIGRWRAGDVPERQRMVAEILAQICSALDLVHGQGIVHRDLKPANIVVMRSGEAKLIDFGLARDLDAAPLTQTGAIVGTLVYMSPEQVLGQRERIDRRSDVYALGATLYEALTLMRPHGGDGDSPLLPQLSGKQPPPPSIVSGNVPVALSAIVEKAMEFEPDLRYATAGDMALDLRRFLAGEKVGARPISALGRLRRRIRRRRKLLAAVAAAVLAVVLGALALSGIERRATRMRAVDAAFEEAGHALRGVDELDAQVTDREGEPGKKLEATRLERFDERLPSLEARDRGAKLGARRRELRDSATLAVQRGLEAAPGDPRLLTLLDELLWTRFIEAEKHGDEEEQRRLEGLLRSYFPADIARLRARGAVSIASDPPGAEVFLFRYEERGRLLQPIPYRPGRGRLLGPNDAPEPWLRVVRPPCEELLSAGVRLGDRVVSIDGEPVGIAGNRHLVRFSTDYESKPIVFQGDGDVRAILFHNQLREPGREVSSRKATTVWLNIACEAEAFPLAFLDDGACGPTPLGAVGIDSGSYLAVLRLDGCRDTRLPFAVERDDRLELRVRLFRDEDLPPGFVHVPAGPVRLGGDANAFYPEAPRLEHLGDYFVGRYEVTFAQYFELLRDPAIVAEIGRAGGVERSHLVPAAVKDGRRVPQCRIDAAGLPAPLSEEDSTWAARHVSAQAAERYVEWLNHRADRNRLPWTYALPSADELEKAARGADGRLFPWGSAFDWSLVCSHLSAASQMDRNFHFPTDASPYDARNLAGGLAELTRTTEVPPGDDARTASNDNLDCRVKGGSGFDDLEPFFHVSGHTRERKKEASYRVGFRLVAYPRSSGSPAPAGR